MTEDLYIGYVNYKCVCIIVVWMMNLRLHYILDCCLIIISIIISNKYWWKKYFTIYTFSFNKFNQFNCFEIFRSHRVNWKFLTILCCTLHVVLFYNSTLFIKFSKRLDRHFAFKLFFLIKTLKLKRCSFFPRITNYMHKKASINLDQVLL